MPDDSCGGAAWKPKGQRSPNPHADQRGCLRGLEEVMNQSWPESRSGTRTMLDNTMPSANVSHRLTYGRTRSEILPNPYGGVNTPPLRGWGIRHWYCPRFYSRL